MIYICKSLCKSRNTLSTRFTHVIPLASYFSIQHHLCFLQSRSKRQHWVCNIIVATTTARVDYRCSWCSVLHSSCSSFCFVILFLMAEPSSKRPKEGNTWIQPLLFEALETDGSNYLEWSINAKSYLCAEELDGTLESPIPGDLLPTLKWKALLILRRHLDVSLRQQYIQVEDLDTLWEQLEAKFHHEKTIFLPQARNNWIHLGILDFPNFLCLTQNFTKLQPSCNCVERRSQRRN